MANSLWNEAHSSWLHLPPCLGERHKLEALLDSFSFELDRMVSENPLPVTLISLQFSGLPLLPFWYSKSLFAACGSIVASEYLPFQARVNSPESFFALKLTKVLYRCPKRVSRNNRRIVFCNFATLSLAVLLQL